MAGADLAHRRRQQRNHPDRRLASGDRTSPLRVVGIVELDRCDIGRTIMACPFSALSMNWMR